MINLGFRDSLKELKSIKCLVITGMLIACYVILKNFLAFNALTIKINFAFLPLAAIGMFFGPFVSVVSAIACDLIAVMTNPLYAGSINPIFTLITMFEGLIYGIFLYRYDAKNKMSMCLSKIIIAQSIIVLIGHLILNTGALYVLGMIKTGESFYSLILMRVVKNLIELPVDLFLIFAVLIPLKTVYDRIILKREPHGQ
ncbi:MAG: folate family ECF transporter S component [Eubacterium sp.]|jgi:ECF transporter S component (folate family)|nr:folate family ECF transporter S component [Eubacterium sp.]